MYCLQHCANNLSAIGESKKKKVKKSVFFVFLHACLSRSTLDWIKCFGNCMKLC